MSTREKKISLEDLQESVTEVREMAERSRDQLKEMTQKSGEQIKELADKSKDQFKEVVEERPFESSIVIFFFGLMIGLMLGVAFSRRD